jgi:glutathione S-transferase
VSDLTLIVGELFDSPYAMSAFVALEEKALSYSVKTLSLRAGDHRKPDYRAATGRIPSLIHGDYVLAESSAIAEYLAEAFPFPKHPRLFPEDLQQRGICRMVQAWMRSDFNAIRAERSTATIFLEAPCSALTDTARGEVQRLVKGADGLIREGRTTLFDAWCIADVDLAIMLQRLNLNGDPLPAKLKAHAEANWARPSVQKWVQHERPKRP